MLLCSWETVKLCVPCMSMWSSFLMLKPLMKKLQIESTPLIHLEGIKYQTFVLMRYSQMKMWVDSIDLNMFVLLWRETKFWFYTFIITDSTDYCLINIRIWIFNSTCKCLLCLFLTICILQKGIIIIIQLLTVTNQPYFIARNFKGN